MNESNESDVPIEIRRPALIYYGLSNEVMECSHPGHIEELTDKDLYVLQALVSQASVNLRTEMQRRRGGSPYEPF